MSEIERKILERDLKRFTELNFERPSACRNLEQIRFYIQELCIKIETFEKRYNYVPSWLYSLLSQYNACQNRIIETQAYR